MKQAEKDLFLPCSLGFKKRLTFNGFSALGRQDRRKCSDLTRKALIGLLPYDGSYQQIKEKKCQACGKHKYSCIPEGQAKCQGMMYFKQIFL